MVKKMRICCSVTLTALLATSGCQTTIPAPDSRRAHHEQSMEYTLDALRAHEKRSPDNLRAADRKLRDLLAGKPESAQTTARRLLEQD